jgi:tRNA A37 methylthiotransferase MiaB
METYGCQMNSSDSEIVMSIMQKAGYEETAALDDVRRSLFFCSLFYSLSVA